MHVVSPRWDTGGAVRSDRSTAYSSRARGVPPPSDTPARGRIAISVGGTGQGGHLGRYTRRAHSRAPAVVPCSRPPSWWWPACYISFAA